VRNSNDLVLLPSSAKASSSARKANCNDPIDALDVLVATQKKSTTFALRLGEGNDAARSGEYSLRQTRSGAGAVASTVQKQVVPIGIGGATDKTDFDVDFDDRLLTGLRGALDQEDDGSATAMTVFCPGSPSFISVCRPGSPENKFVCTEEDVPESPSVVFMDILDTVAPKPRRPRQPMVRFECHRFPGEDEAPPSKPAPRPSTGGRPRRVAIGGA